MDSAESTSCCSRVEIETEEQRDKRLQRRRERERERRASESEEMREDRLSKRRAGDRARRASESAEMREKRLSTRRAGDSARRASLSGSFICAINAFPECCLARRTLFGHHFLLRNQCANLTQRPGTPVPCSSLLAQARPTMIIICLVYINLCHMYGVHQIPLVKHQLLYCVCVSDPSCMLCVFIFAVCMFCTLSMCMCVSLFLCVCHICAHMCAY